jgi:outer membrane lipoprotein-sorting protein
VAGSVALGGIHADSAFASQHPKLPAKTPLQLLTAVQSSKTDALSGTITESAHWGLPSLPGANDTASLNWQTLLTGSHTVRFSISDPAHQRLAVLGSLSESDVVRNGNDVWTYTSTDNTVTHTVLAAETAKREHHPAADAPADKLTPQGAARELLGAVNPSTAISVDPTQRIAGRSAYTLVLTPRDSRSTVRKVEIALDSKQFIPLRVRLFGAGSTPAFETAFNSISFRTPAASMFQFLPPAGASTTNDPFGISGTADGKHSDEAGVPQLNQLKLLGSGWTSVLEIPASSATAGLLPKASAGSDGGSSARSPLAPLASLTKPVGYNGDRLLHTSVVNALLTANGRMFIGAVSPKLLEDAAAGTFK